MAVSRHQSSLPGCRGSHARGAIAGPSADDKIMKSMVSVARALHWPDAKVIVCSQCDETPGAFAAN
jgi:hypothetical protein